MTASNLVSIARRRAWIVLLAVIGGILGALAVDALQQPRYTAGATLLVSADDPFNSTRLAQTYANALPDDGGLLGAVSDELGVEEEDVPDALSVEADTDTAVMRLEYRAPDEDEALRGAEVAVEAMTGESPEAVSVPAELLEVIREPRVISSPPSGVPTTALALGGILGLFLGLVLAVGRERSDRRVDSEQDLTRALRGVPATRLRGGRARLAPALLERWRELSGSSAPLIAMVSTRDIDGAALESLATRALNGSAGETARERAVRARKPAEAGAAVAPIGGDGGTAVRLYGPERVVADAGALDHEAGISVIVGGPLGTDGSAEMVAQRTDITVIAARRGTREREIESQLELLEHFGVAPSWGLLIG